MKVLLSGGGTAGHINPALAIAKYIQKKEPKTEFLFVGAKGGMEQMLVPREGFEIREIQISGLIRKITAENILTAVRTVGAYFKSRKIIRDFSPDIVIGTGGYVCAPVVMAAADMKVPTIIHEQNVFPGLAIRMLKNKANITAISFDETRQYLKGAKRVELTGNPIREGLTLPVKRNQAEIPGVLISGGSLGAKKINEALLEMLCLDIRGKYRLVASVGERYYSSFCEELKERGISTNQEQDIRPYIYNMDEEMGKADIAVTRAGAITVSELCAMGKPAIIIPSPNVTNDHQTYNARLMEKCGAAVMITEAELSGQKLSSTILSLLSDRKKLNEMSEAARKAAIVTATETIYRFTKELTTRQGR